MVPFQGCYTFFSSFFNHVDSIIARDPAARGRFDVMTCYPGLHAVWFYRFTHFLWRKNFRWVARILALVSRFFTGIEIHPGAVIGHRLFIDHGFGVVIGETAVIGDDCTLYHGVTLGSRAVEQGFKRHPTLEAGVTVYAGAKILGNFTVGTGARIGANGITFFSRIITHTHYFYLSISYAQPFFIVYYFVYSCCFATSSTGNHSLWCTCKNI